MKQYIITDFKLFESDKEKKKLREEKKKWEIWSEWKTWINMSKKELKDFYNSKEGKDAGLSRSEANKKGIDSGRESARMLMKMIPYGSNFEKALKNWTDSMWEWAKKQNSFNSRMYGMRKRAKGNPWKNDDGTPSDLLLSLKIWGFNPEKDRDEKPDMPEKYKNI